MWRNTSVYQSQKNIRWRNREQGVTVRYTGSPSISGAFTLEIHRLRVSLIVEEVSTLVYATTSACTVSSSSAKNPGNFLDARSRSVALCQRLDCIRGDALPYFMEWSSGHLVTKPNAQNWAAILFVGTESSRRFCIFYFKKVLSHPHISWVSKGMSLLSIEIYNSSNSNTFICWPGGIRMRAWG